jgi:hypothetical protein
MICAIRHGPGRNLTRARETPGGDHKPAMAESAQHAPPCYYQRNQQQQHQGAQEGRGIRKAGDKDTLEAAAQLSPRKAATARLRGGLHYRRNSMIYFIQDTAGNIKIGHANNVRSRFRSLQTAHATKLRLLATIPGNVDDERALHRRFINHRLGGEWFRPVPELLEFIGVKQQAPAAPRKRAPLFPISPDERIAPLITPDDLQQRSPLAGLIYALCIFAVAAAFVIIAGGL